MQARDTDIFISGGGLAGLAAALGFAAAGFSVTLADPAPAEAAPDLRSTAFLAPARDFLARAGIWDALAPDAVPLERLRVADCVGEPPAIRTERTFRADDLGAEAFGWNLPNHLARKVLLARLAAEPRADLRLGTGFARLATRDAHALVTLGDGTRLRARLAIAADGRASPLRAAVGIATETTRYGQKALAFSVTHDEPHRNVSTEIYHAGGAFVLVPLADHKDRPASAVVWMQDGPEALRLADLGDADFALAATRRSAGVFGRLAPFTPRQIWPVVTQRATRLAARRTALVAEAAHVLPPIGAQGLNSSLQDIAALVELAREAPGALGSEAFLDRFERARAADLRARAGVIDLYNRLCSSGAAPLQAARGLGLRLVHDIAPLRRGVMRAGLGG